jgi:multidrug resistance efflux pump
LDDRVNNLRETRDTSVAAAKSRVQAALDRVGAAQQALVSAEATLFAAERNVERQKKLNAKGLASDRTLELAIAEHNRSKAEVERAKNNVDIAKAEHEAAVSELNRTDADARTRIDEALASKASAESDVAKAISDLSKAEAAVARQSAQVITAPTDGIIHRVDSMQTGGFLKGGEPLAILLPVSSNLVVELFLNGNDIPLVTKGRKARIQFEGWPAVQIVGWPCMAIGTFGGEIINIDPTENGEGKFRVLIAPDKDDMEWPTTRYLRQGVRANGWVLLDRVPLWYELWRQFNGFPPLAGSKELASEAQKKIKKN